MDLADTVTLNGVAVPTCHIGVSNNNDGELTIDGADGILGIGPDALSTYNNPDGVIIPTIVTSMYQAKIIHHNVFSVYFQPLEYDTKIKQVNGELVLGGVNMSYVEGNVTYAPISTNPDFSDYWAVDIDNIRTGSRTFTYPTKLVALVDTGSTLIFLPAEIVQAVFKGVHGSRRDFTGQYIVPCDSDKLRSVNFTMGGVEYELYPEDYLITDGPLKYPVKGRCHTYLMESPSYVDVILGYGFLQQFVSVYDVENKRMGFGRRKELNEID
ncbi:hypothetical protein DFQ30_004873 [Apophysomyces sp. BC1015]|nr:hypothetical protein DFQ30_004873 [Apophysomyces sp. BC1015]